MFNPTSHPPKVHYPPMEPFEPAEKQIGHRFVRLYSNSTGWIVQTFNERTASRYLQHFEDWEAAAASFKREIASAYRN